MTIQLGENLKKLRRTRDVTQEELATALGTSPQSVSNWERGDCYPDMELVPRIAGYFEVTLDELFGMSDLKAQERIIEQLKLDGDGYELSQSPEIWKKSLDNWRGIARDYPNNYTAQSFFAQRLIGLGETMEELDKNGKEAISVCERVLERCTDSKIRHDVEAILPNAYSLTGDTKKAIECAFALPRAQQGMENALAFIVNFDKNFKQYEHLTHSETRDILHANAIMAVFLCQTQILTLFGRVGTVDNQPAVNYLEDEPDAGLVNAFEDISSVLERHFQYLYDKIK